jgi:alanyl-tRNA synthetase
MQNHTSTHMLNWALREVLGDHIQQKGSLVDPEKTRFDFSHNKPVSPEQLDRIERLVNGLIQKDLPVNTKEVPLDQARKMKTVRAVFGEKYADPVRVVSVGADIQEMIDNPDDPKWMQYPVELCGGTHLKRSSEAERFVLATEEAVGKGVRRLVGITGEAAQRAEEAGQTLLAEAEALAGNPPVAPGHGPIPNRDREGADTGADVDHDSQALDAEAVTEFRRRIEDATIPLRVRHELQDRIGQLQKKAKKEQKKAAAASGDAVKDQVAKLLESAEKIGGVTILVGEVPTAPVEALRGAIDWVRNKVGASAVLLAMADDGKVTLIAGMSKDAVSKGVKAGDLIKEVAPLVGGRGGGRPDMAQGGGNDPAGLPAALDSAMAWIREKLA